MTPQKFNCDQAKNLDIVTYLELLGCKSTKVQGNDYWYYSPFHKERTPSFKVNRKLNVWYDHSLGKGGNLVDFGIHYHQCAVADFLEKLNQHHNHFSFHQQHQPPVKSVLAQDEKAESKMQVLAIQDLQSAGLKDYFQKRAISILNAEKYCKEVLVRNRQQQFSMIGFRNNSGGFELRSISNIKAPSPQKISAFFSMKSPH